MVIFISGASGYLGSLLVNALSVEHDVYALIRRTSSKDRLQQGFINIIYIDEYSELENAFKMYSPELIINTAALYGRKGELLSELVEANISFPVKLLELAGKYKSKAYINTGTSLPGNISTYASTKNAFVNLAKFKSEMRVKFINIELEHFYGPKDDSSKFISYVIDACLKGENIDLTTGLQTRDFIYIDDVIMAYKVVIKNIPKLDYFENIPLGSGVAPTIQSVVKLIHKCSNSKSRIEFGAKPIRENELMHSCANINKIESLGWSSCVELKSGIQKVITYNE